MARVVFEIKDSLRDLFKAAVASEGLQMSEVLREFVSLYSLHPRAMDASPAEIADLESAAMVAVDALYHKVPEQCWFPSTIMDCPGCDAIGQLRAAFAPFKTGAATEEASGE